jgi:hypothetical protein
MEIEKTPVSKVLKTNLVFSPAEESFAEFLKNFLQRIGQFTSDKSLLLWRLKAAMSDIPHIRDMLESYVNGKDFNKMVSLLHLQLGSTHLFWDSLVQQLIQDLLKQIVSPMQLSIVVSG